MKGKIKIISLLMAMAMVTSMFVGCGAKEEAPPESSTTNASDIAVSSKADDTASKADAGEAVRDTTEPVKLKWYTYGEAPKGDPKPVIDALNAMTKKAINTEVEFIWTGGDDQKVKTMMSTGGDFDITFTGAWFANYVLAAQGGQLADITEKVKTVTPKLYEYIPEVMWEGNKVDGKIYSVPTYKDSAAAYYWTANKEYVIDKVGAEKEFKAAGRELSSLTPLLEKVKAYGDKNGYDNDLTAPFNLDWGGIPSLAVGWDNLGIDKLQLGIKMDTGDYKVLPKWEDPAFIADLKIAKSWHDTGLTNKDALTREKMQEHIIVSAQQCWDGSEAVLANGKPYTVAINKRHGPVFMTSTIQGSTNGISPNSKNIDRALMFLEIVNTDKEYRNTLAYGIKDVNWEITESGNAKALNADWAPALFAQGSFFELYPLAPAPADMYVNLKATNDAATPSPVIGFVPNTVPIANEIASSGAVVDKYIRSLTTGDCQDVDATCTKALKEMRAAGYDKVLAEMQKQIDAFVASK